MLCVRSLFRLTQCSLRCHALARIQRRNLTGDGAEVSSISSLGFRLSRSGRFSGETDEIMERFNASLPYDKRMWRQDIEGSIAYASALGRAGLLSSQEVSLLHSGLDQVADEWKMGTFDENPGDEDIHTANERRLTELVGAVGGKLHTGRSRNDQVVTDVRMWLRDELRTQIILMKDLVNTILIRAENELDYIMPGYTHLQRAQPIRWSHWLLCYAWQWKRDIERLEGILPRVNLLPLGVGALSGHPFGIDRHLLARDLKFDGIISNSLDAVGDRDFILEYLMACSLVMLHFSRIAEDLILYSSSEFAFVKLADAYATGSSYTPAIAMTTAAVFFTSIDLSVQRDVRFSTLKEFLERRLMPQKKNPDALELLRGFPSQIALR